jgi:hypothetical protein
MDFTQGTNGTLHPYVFYNYILPSIKNSSPYTQWVQFVCLYLRMYVDITDYVITQISVETVSFLIFITCHCFSS